MAASQPDAPTWTSQEEAGKLPPEMAQCEKQGFQMVPLHGIGVPCRGSSHPEARAPAVPSGREEVNESDVPRAAVGGSQSLTQCLGLLWGVHSPLLKLFCVLRAKAGM